MLKVISHRWLPAAAARPLADPRVADLRAGDAAMIEQVLHELLPMVRGWLYRRLGPDAALDDAMQEALTEIARALPSFQGQSSLGVYAYRITARVAARQIRRRMARRELVVEAASSPPEPSDGRDPERMAIERQALRRVLACLARLPARRREAFVLCELEGLSCEQAAACVGASPGAIRSRLMHARRELDRRLRGGDELLDREGAVGGRRGGR